MFVMQSIDYRKLFYMAKLEKNEHTFIYLFIYMKYSVSHFQVS